MPDTTPITDAHVKKQAARKVGKERDERIVDVDEARTRANNAQTSADNAKARADHAHTRIDNLSFLHIAGTIDPSTQVSNGSIHVGNKGVSGSINSSGLFADNVVGGGALSSTSTSRAVSSAHCQDNFLVARHFPANVVGFGSLSSSATDDTVRAVGGGHIKEAVLQSSHLSTELINWLDVRYVNA